MVLIHRMQREAACRYGRMPHGIWMGTQAKGRNKHNTTVFFSDRHGLHRHDDGRAAGAGPSTEGTCRRPVGRIPRRDVFNNQRAVSLSLVSSSGSTCSYLPGCHPPSPRWPPAAMQASAQFNSLLRPATDTPACSGPGCFSLGCCWPRQSIQPIRHCLMRSS